MFEESLRLFRQLMTYRTLRGRADVPLRAIERESLAELEWFFREHASHRAQSARPARRLYRRFDIDLPVRFATPLGNARGKVNNLSGGGAYVETLAPLPHGSRTVLRITDGENEYRLAAEVAWVDGERGMGLRLSGMPLELHVRRTIRRAA